MTSVDTTALRLLGKHGLNNALIEAEQCYYGAPSNKKEYWGLVVDYLKAI